MMLVMCMHNIFILVILRKVIIKKAGEASFVRKRTRHLVVPAQNATLHALPVPVFLSVCYEKILNQTRVSLAHNTYHILHTLSLALTKKITLILASLENLK